jgi:hypothetical protein
MAINADAVEATAEHARRLFDVANQLAPEPLTRDDATAQKWSTHYAARALAAHSAFRAATRSAFTSGQPASRPDFGYLTEIATAATAAAIAFDTGDRHEAADELWDYTPELGALNGEYIDWLADALVDAGINPADLHPWYSAADFNPPSRLAELDPTLPEALGVEPTPVGG